MPREPQCTYGTAIGLSSDLTCRSYGWWSKEPKTQNKDNPPENEYSDTVGGYLKSCAVLGSAPCALGATALSSREGTLPLQGDATQPPRLTPRMTEVATAHLLLQENSRETSTEKRKKREEKEGANHRKTSPTPLPRELERDARGLEKQSGQGWVTRRPGTLACWHSGLWAVAQVRVCSSQTRNLSLSFFATHGVETLERPGNPTHHDTP